MNRMQALLGELLSDAQFGAAMALIAKEAEHTWNLSERMAYGYVLSAIGHPDVLEEVYQAWTEAKRAGNTNRPKLIMRRLVLKLLVKDARRRGHVAVNTTDDPADGSLTALRADQRNDPDVQLEQKQQAILLRNLLHKFARLGKRQARQAALIKAHDLDGKSPQELCEKLGCSPGALRVRLHEARGRFKIFMSARRRHLH